MEKLTRYKSKTIFDWNDFLTKASLITAVLSAIAFIVGAFWLIHQVMTFTRDVTLEKNAVIKELSDRQSYLEGQLDTLQGGEIKKIIEGYLSQTDTAPKKGSGEK